MVVSALNSSGNLGDIKLQERSIGLVMMQKVKHYGNGTGRRGGGGWGAIVSDSKPRYLVSLVQGHPLQILFAERDRRFASPRSIMVNRLLV